ncbi:hypothetical protein SAMN05443574_112117 [Haloarcula vallismortis]|uniref:Uncharacterized protein n=2 Tax=Haloarcula vallismortis TaxID=28442 RepID=M0IZG4_HALVA|nr:hypothetical protein [Haloarcula vallismortis]EMA01473.1 hypothetical protein C437_17291 [Haloarcula vallismortis ATCC 29715]SDX04392.1 hypothetical protein SAMN05443574_112117 [Haloarcula vallismortis]
MAHLNDDEQGQIILIAALALAVTFIGLALVVNSAIYTQNLASRGEVAGSNDALEMRAMVETNVGQGIVAANRYNYSSQTALETSLRESMGTVSTQTERQRVTSGALVNATLTGSPTYGTRIAQNDTSQFQSNGAAGNWTVRERVTRPGDGTNATRRFVINATEIPTDSADAFAVTANGTSGGPNWTMRVWGDVGPSGTVNVEVDTPSGIQTCVVSIEEPYAHIDVTGGTVQGEPCLALQGGSFDGRFAHGVGDEYNITYESGNMTRGNYSMVVLNGDSAGTVNTAPPSPFETTAIYNATVRYRYDTSNLQYEVKIRVAPGEPNAS